MWNFFKSIIAAFCDILDLGNKSAPPEKTLPAASSDSGKREIVAKSLPRISWWDKKEAEYWRNRCFMHFALSGGRKCVLERPLCGA